MINAVIVEDEPIHLEYLTKKIEEFTPGVNIVANFSSGGETLKNIKKLKFDLLFLDIELGEMNAFELLEKIKMHDIHIIFITAYDDYAIKAFKVNAVDYLLKPIDGNELRDAVLRFVKYSFSKEKRINLLSDYHLFKTNKLLISEKSALIFIPCDDIIYCNSNINYTEIHYIEAGKTVKVISTKNLLHFDQKLSEFNFLRISQSILVNTNHIRKIMKRSGKVILQNGDVLPISKRKKKEVLEYFNKFLLH